MKRVAMAAVLILQTGGALAQGEGGGAGYTPPPRWPDGRVNLGPPPGEIGVWDASQRRLVNDPDAYDAANLRGDAPLHIDEVPLQDWARALTNFRHALAIASEPYTRCKPTGGPRQVMSPYGFEIVDLPDLQRVYILTVANSMSYRVIYMDGREHPQNLSPSYFGHSVGWWEGDTLVVDTVGMNERNWMNRDALPHTDRLHLVERFTRHSLEEMDYSVTVDDPGAYTAPWISGYTLRWAPGLELFEYVCQENNLSPASMIGVGGESRIIP